MPPSALAGGSCPQTASTSSPREITRLARIARMPRTACCLGCPTRSSSLPFHTVTGPSTPTRNTTVSLTFRLPGPPHQTGRRPPPRAEASSPRLPRFGPRLQKKSRSPRDSPLIVGPHPPCTAVAMRGSGAPGRQAQLGRAGGSARGRSQMTANGRDGRPGRVPAIERASRRAEKRRAPAPEASGYCYPEWPTLTAPPSLPAVRVGTLVLAVPGRPGRRPLPNRRAILPNTSLCALSARGRANGMVSVIQDRSASAGLLGLRERPVQVTGQQPQRVPD